eukprot:gene36372-44122_t
MSFASICSRKIFHSLGWTTSRPSSVSISGLACRFLATERKILMNNDIPVDKMRLIFIDPKSSKKEHKIVTKKEALAMAKKMNLDVVAMNLEADPPVCKLESYGRILMEEREKERAHRASQRTQVTKEVQVVL